MEVCNNKKTQIKFRKMQESDIDKILEIEKRVYGQHCWSKDGFSAELNNQNGNYFSAFDAETNELLGYGGFWIVIDEAHITTIAVNPDFQNKGIGEALLQKFIDVGHEEEVKWFTLEVRITNLPAQNLYKKYSFESCGVRHKYYQDTQEDGLIMWTENIQSDKFKSKYLDLKTKLSERVSVI